jgi:hypothetical protein
MATNQPMPKPPSGLHEPIDTETVIIPLGDHQPKAGPPVKK